MSMELLEFFTPMFCVVEDFAKTGFAFSANFSRFVVGMTIRTRPASFVLLAVMLCCSTLFVEGMTMCTGPASFVLKDHFHPSFSFLHTSGKANFLLPLRRHILSLRHYSFVSAKITFFSFCKGCSPYSIFGHIFFDRSDFFCIL